MPSPSATRGYLSVIASALIVGGGVTAASYLVNFPVYLSQSIRYGIGAIILGIFARSERVTNKRLTHAERGYLLLVTALGLVSFSVCSLEALRSASAPSVAIVIGAVPILLALVGPYMDHRIPTLRPLVGAVAVVAGTAVVEGTGHASPAGVAWAFGALLSDAGFSLFSVPLVRKIGPFTLSFRTAILASASLGLLDLLVPGQKLPSSVSTIEIVAILFQGTFVTVGAFVWWYRGLAAIHVERVGLFPGLIPVGALLSAAVLSRPIGNPVADLVGILLLLTGIYYGATGKAAIRNHRDPASPIELRPGTSGANGH